MDRDTKQEPQREPAPEYLPVQAFLGAHQRMASTLKDVQAELSAPLTPEEAKEIVDGLLQGGRHLRKPHQKDFPYGIPTTPKEFQDFYYKKSQYPNVKLKVGTDPEAYAEQAIRTLRQHHMPVITELHKRGINSDHYWHSVTDQLIKPAGFDIQKLNHNLTEPEKEFVRFRVAVAQFLEEKGLLVSTEKNAPKESSWARRVRQSLAEETKAALASLR